MSPSLFSRSAAAAALPIAFATVAMTASVGWAADSRGCTDAAGLKRFEGSSIGLCAQRTFAEYTLPTGKAASCEVNREEGTVEASERLEGRLVQNVYGVPRGPCCAEVFRNYTLDLDAKGYERLFEPEQGAKGPCR